MFRFFKRRTNIIKRTNKLFTMKKYYVYKDGLQQGPFTIDELVNLNITHETLIWYEGIEDWKKAVELEELNVIIKNIPPPVTKNKTQTPPPISKNKALEKNPLPRKKIKLVIIIVLVVLIVGFLFEALYRGYQVKQNEIQEQIDEQREKIDEQEKIEEERRVEKEKQIKKEKAIQRQAELDMLKYEYDQALINYQAAQIQLNSIQEFKFLRTESEKQQQVQDQLEIISDWASEIERIENELKKYQVH